MKNRRRDLLHRNKTEDFKKFLITQGYNIQIGTNCYEVIRAKRAGKIISFYQKNTNQHLTTSGYGTELAKQFIYGNKNQGNKQCINNVS